MQQNKRVGNYVVIYAKEKLAYLQVIKMSMHKRRSSPPGMQYEQMLKSILDSNHLTSFIKQKIINTVAYNKRSTAKLA